jgi:hypothetical protein
LCHYLFALVTVQFSSVEGDGPLVSVLVYTLGEVDWNIGIQENVSSSVLAAANLGTKVKYL